MSTSIQQIIEIRINGKWTYVPLADTFNDNTNTIEKCGSVRDLFACKWHNAEDYMNFGVPEDISKEAREAMIYREEDFINSGACWISWQQYEALSESLRQKMLADVEKLANIKSESRISKRLDKIENALAVHMFGKSVDEIKEDMGTDPDENDWMDEDYCREELEDHMWAWCMTERNMGEIEAYVDRFLNQNYDRDTFPGMDTGVRVIMYVS